MRNSVTIDTFEKAFPDEATCQAYMFFHANGLALRCAGHEKVPTWKPMARRSSFHCPLCWRIEGVRAQSIFKGTRISVRKTFYAMLLMLDLPGGASIQFLQRQLGLSHRAAWALANRIRLHMAALETPRMIGGPGQTVWIDETAIRLQGEAQLTSIFGMADLRNLFLRVVPDRKSSTLIPLIEKGVARGSEIVTDAFSAYRRLEHLGWKHYRLNHSRGIWADEEGHATARIELVWRWLKRQIAGSTGQIAHDQLWKHIKQFLYQYHARENPAEAYWRLISTYPPLDRYREETLRREVDGRLGVSSTAGAEAGLRGSGLSRHVPVRLLPLQRLRDCGPSDSISGSDEKALPFIRRGADNAPRRSRHRKNVESGMSQTLDLRDFRPVFQVLDTKAARCRRIQEIFLLCDLSVRVLAVVEELEPFPDECSLVLLHDSLDGTTDQLVNACLAGGHGVVLYRQDHQLPRVVDLLGRGVVGYLGWPFDCDDLRRTIRAAETYGYARTQLYAYHGRAKALVNRLSQREKQVLSLVCAGRTSEDIARALGLSKRTIECHRANILARLKVGSASAMRLGIYAGLDRPEPWPSELASEPTSAPHGAETSTGRRRREVEV